MIFLKEKLGADVGPVKCFPYSVEASISFSSGIAIAVWQDDTGFAIRVKTEDENLADEIVGILEGLSES